MRLFWKLFCSMVTITVLSCSIGGYVLIDAQFRTSLEREVDSLYEENDLLRYALTRETEINPVANQESLARLAEEIHITTGRGTVAFRISDENGAEIVSNGSIPVEAAGLTESLSSQQRGWELTYALGERAFLHAASPLIFEDATLYLESCREVTGLFAARQEQYHIFFYLMLALILAAGVLSLVVSTVILRPLARLSAATKRMAAGDLKQRVKVDSDDELGRLSEDFNTMAARLASMVQELTDAARRQEDFIDSFAHEIKTPLTSLIGYADLLRSLPATPEQVRERAGYIFSEGRRLEALSRKMMDLIVLNKQEFTFYPIPMADFLERVGGAFRPALEQQGIHLEILAAEADILIEPDLMETVCLNLLDNARKAIEGCGCITLEGLSEETGYCIRVSDNGKGIPDEELSRITEAFYMVDKSRARAQGGAGLGLAICQRIVALHGGSIEFQSKVDQGTHVLVHLRGGEAV